MKHTEDALVGRLLRAHKEHAEVTVDLKGVRGYVVSVSSTGSHATVWDGDKEVDIPVWAIKDVRPPVPDDGERVAAPARRGVASPKGEQIALDFSDEQLGFKLD